MYSEWNRRWLDGVDEQRLAEAALAISCDAAAAAELLIR
jgi:hypothetical protein